MGHEPDRVQGSWAKEVRFVKLSGLRAVDEDHVAVADGISGEPLAGEVASRDHHSRHSTRKRIYIDPMRIDEITRANIEDYKKVHGDGGTRWILGGSGRIEIERLDGGGILASRKAGYTVYFELRNRYGDPLAQMQVTAARTLMERIVYKVAAVESIEKRLGFGRDLYYQVLKSGMILSGSDFQTPYSARVWNWIASLPDFAVVASLGGEYRMCRPGPEGEPVFDGGSLYRDHSPFSGKNDVGGAVWAAYALPRKMAEKLVSGVRGIPPDRVREARFQGRDAARRRAPREPQQEFSHPDLQKAWLDEYDVMKRRIDHYESHVKGLMDW
jgi:hypothetical protein